MRTRVKICGITRPEDATAVVDAGADAIGLVFYDPSPRAVTIEQAVAICHAVPAFVTVTALFVNAAEQVVNQVIDRVGVDLLQFHGNEPPDYCQQFSRPYMKALRVKPGLNISEQAERYQDAKALLLDAYRPGVPGGTGETFDWQLIPEDLSKPVILAGGLTPQNVATAVRQVRPFGVDVSGGVEAAKGIKDSQLVTQFINEVSCADQS
ncbi:MAG: phosphoribosylanthranilate isomerase [Motiliproteus sp.]|nr:phosphoribosylanthranilate isomerase [Motiliproteus sp.]MCW9051134.1 phosphoribosylanthranilate isomerase [Motiliproteus sp.]